MVASDTLISPIQRAIARFGPERFLSAFSSDELLRLKYDWHMWARPSQLPPPGDWVTWLIMAGRGYGKALALDTQVPTVAGWTQMGDIKVGDTLFDELGSPCRVTYVSPIQIGNRCYQVVFDDGSVIVADGSHQWQTWDKAARKSEGRRIHRPPQRRVPPQSMPRSFPSVRTTEEVKATLRVSRGREVNHSIPTTLPLKLPDASLPVDPYVLGLWLGDGDSQSATLTVGNADLTDILWQLMVRGVSIGRTVQDRKTGVWRVPIGIKPASRDSTGRFAANDSIHSRLKSAGLLKNKHIPEVYLRASPQQRLDLLAGLMDSDGYCSRSGHVEFTSTNESLSVGVLELVRSLGFKPTRISGRSMLEGRDCGPKWRLTWTAHVPIFRLGRKLARQHFGKSQKERIRRRYIVDVVTIPSVPSGVSKLIRPILCSLRAMP